MNEKSYPFQINIAVQLKANSTVVQKKLDDMNALLSQTDMSLLQQFQSKK